MSKLVALFFSCMFAFTSSLQPCAAQGTADFGAVYLTTLPSGADVWVDGTYVGRTPVLLDGLPSGKHAMTLTKAGWNVAEVLQQIEGRTVTANSVVMQRDMHAHGSPGRIAFHGLPPGGHVSLDGLQSLSGPIYYTSSGTHKVVVHVGKLKIFRDVKVYPDTTTDVVIPVSLASAGAVRTKFLVVAPAEQYLPDSAFRVEHGKVIIAYGGHSVVGHVGRNELKMDKETLAFDAPPVFVHGKLYLPLDLLLQLTGHSSKGK
ncbi:MAG: PEGA domain-containing protein [Candidatus Eremiobacteraeota bacterium]|nr:PEGA domain-containing protein [Candidatus Eremiobacteraeota bacterium]